MKSLKKINDSLDKINEFSKSLGIEQQTIFKVKHSKENEKILSLANGDLNAPEPWFVIDENEQIHTMISLKSLKNLLESLKQSQKENLELRLEKAIYQQIPVDFDDVWTVAMDTIKHKAKNGFNELNIDLEKLVAQIKKEHPSLFVDMQAMMEKVRNNNERL